MSVGTLGVAYFRIFTASFLTDLTSSACHTALLLHLYVVTGQDSAYLGLYALATLLPTGGVALLGGVWAERYSRRSLLLVCELLRLALLLLLLFSVGHVWAVLLLQGLLSAVGALALPSRQAIIPELVQAAGVPLANTLDGWVRGAVLLVGPLLGAALHARSSGLFVLLVACAWISAAAVLLLAGVPSSPPAAGSGPRASLLRDIVEGYRYVRSERGLFHLFVLSLTAGLAVGLLDPLLRPFVGQVLRGGDQTYGQLMAAFGVGGLIGPLLSRPAVRRFGLGRTMLVAFLAESMLMVAWACTPWSQLSCALFFLWGLNNFLMLPCQSSYVHEHARPECMGRTFALLDQSSYVPQVLAAVLVVVAGNHFSSQALLTAGGLLYLGVVVATWRMMGARALMKAPSTFGAG